MWQLPQLPNKHFYKYLNGKAPGIAPSGNRVWSGEQCGAEAAKAWREWGDQPEVVWRSQRFSGTFSLVSSQKAEGSLAWGFRDWLCGQRPGGHRCLSNCMESISCHLNPVSLIIQLAEYLGDSGCGVYDTHSELACIISVHLRENGGSHHKDQHSSTGVWCLGWQSEPMRQGLRARRTSGIACFTWGSQSEF